MTAAKDKKTTDEQFDRRTLELYMRQGKIDKKEYENYLKSLPDEKDRVAYIDVYEEPLPEEPTPHVSENLTFSV